MPQHHALRVQVVHRRVEPVKTVKNISTENVHKDVSLR